MDDPATPRVPPLSPEWPPTTDQLAEIAKAVHWQLDQLAYDLANRPHLTADGRLGKIADDLDALARLLRHRDTTDG